MFRINTIVILAVAALACVAQARLSFFDNFADKIEKAQEVVNELAGEFDD